MTVVLTTPACPLKDMIKNACINAVKLLVNKDAIVTVNFSSSTSSNRKDGKTILSGVKNIIAIHGKGCLLGIEFDGPCVEMHTKLLEQKIITGTSSDPKVLRLLPPLCVTTDEIDLLVEVLSN